MTGQDDMPPIPMGRDTAVRGDESLAPAEREVELRVRYWGLLRTPEFERWKRRLAAGWGLQLRVFTDSAMLDIMLLNIARTYRGTDRRYVHAPLSGDADPGGSAGDPGARNLPGPGESKAPVKVFDHGDAFLDELVRRRIAGDPARSRAVRLSEYGRLDEIRRALVQRHKDFGAVTDSQIVDAMMAVFHGVEAGRCRLSGSRKAMPPRAGAALERGDPRNRPESGE